MDAKGNELYNHRLPGSVTHDVDFMAFNNRYILLGYWSGLSAYRAKTGKLAWKVGR